MPKSESNEPRLRRRQQNQRRVQDLLEAAWQIFCEKGYDAVTIDEVARTAGCSRMPVYTQFGDKQTLFFELWRRDTQLVSTLLLDALPPGAKLRDNLATLAKRVAEQLRSDKPPHGEQLWFVVQTIALSRPEIAARLQQGANRVVADMALMVRDSVLAEGECLRAEPETVAALICAQINGLTTVQFQTQRKYASEADLFAIFCATAFT